MPELLHHADVVIHLLHAGFVTPSPCPGSPTMANTCPTDGRHMHARRIVPGEERLVGLRIVAVEKVDDL
jgi:hypothetical protein